MPFDHSRPWVQLLTDNPGACPLKGSGWTGPVIFPDLGFDGESRGFCHEGLDTTLRGTRLSLYDGIIPNLDRLEGQLFAIGVRANRPMSSGGCAQLRCLAWDVLCGGEMLEKDKDRIAHSLVESMP